MPPDDMGEFHDAQGIELRIDDKVAFTSSALSNLTIGRVLRLYDTTCDVKILRQTDGGGEYTQNVNSFEIVLIPELDKDG